MYDPITIVRVRKATKITIPAGGWLMLYGPETPLHQQLAARSVLVKDGNVNEDYSELQIGRIQDSSSPVKFLTAKEDEAIAQQRVSREEAIRNQNEKVIAIQKKREEDEVKAADVERKSQVEKINKQHEKLKQSIQSGRDSSPKIQIEKETE